MAGGTIRVEVIRAWRGGYRSQSLELEHGATLADALAVCGIDLAGVAGHAIHGERAQPSRVLEEGDRVELLGPLLADPKEARRRRAAR